MTRLFSRDRGENEWRTLFRRSEMLDHIRTLYANWSSISFYSSEELRAQVDESISGFQTFNSECEAFLTLEQMHESEFLSRVVVFKEGLRQVFFAPEVVAAAIESSTKIGNRYVELINSARAHSSAKAVGRAFGTSHDLDASLAAAKTMSLSAILRTSADDPNDIDGETAEVHEAVAPAIKETFIEREKKNFSVASMFRINKWFLIAALLVGSASGAAYYWSENLVSNGSSAAVQAREIDISDTDLKEHVTSAKASNTTLYFNVQNTYDALTDDGQKAFVAKLRTFAEAKGFKKVAVLNFKGFTVAFAEGDKVELIKPY